MELVEVKNEKDLAVLMPLLKEIWAEVFTPIIGADQVAYMLANYQSQANIEDEMTQAGEEFLHKEGYQNAEWILLDFGNCVAHIFTEEARRFYGLESLWGEAPTVEYED